MKILFKNDKKAYGCFPDFVKIFVSRDNGFIRAKNVQQRNSFSETEFLKKWLWPYQFLSHQFEMSKYLEANFFSVNFYSNKISLISVQF